MTEPAASADAFQEHPGLLPDDLPDAQPVQANGATPVVDVSLRSSALTIKLALLERAHAATARTRFRRRLLMLLAFVVSVGAGAIIGGISGAGVHELLYERPPTTPYRTSARVVDEKGKAHYFVDDQEVDYVQYQVFQQSNRNTQPSYPDNRRADAAGILTGLSIGLLFPFLIWLFLIRRIGRGVPDGLDLEEQIAAIVRAHPVEVESWGGPIVLRNWDLVRELLDIERNAHRPSRQGAR